MKRRHSAAIIVTGSSGGIRFEIASRLAAEGNALGICARGADQLEAATAQLLKLTRAGVDDLGGLDGLVVNAGGSFGGDLEHSTPEDWESTYRINVGHAERDQSCSSPSPGCRRWADRRHLVHLRV
jgi:3-oxoacyl-[acyl-carrier protein] reductase